ncbi:ABC transporter permease subunit [Desulfovibrio mangrovi]|uniref:ABC transporter permease subunit n=1 Tax=Desulfovibrio mangrovi TaxID=2976983 RepID=UPI002246696C|nr:ABC transporter permease subunit [Desulfovibrio mangrovi]UZP67517.1 ABC transporter permease subunit [Desulfovibrio mangrovi]
MNKPGLHLLRAAVWIAALLVPLALAALTGVLVVRGAGALDVDLFFGGVPALAAITGRIPVWDGIWPACAGTVSLLALTMLLALGPGIGCGIYLATCAPTRIKAVLGFAIDLLAGIPSIVMGLFGFTMLLLLRRTIAPQASASLLLAACCLALLVLPVLVSTTRAALEALPLRLHLTGAALGLGKWQTIRHILLPSSARGILGGVLLAAGRAAEDTAVIMLTGAVANAGLPAGITSRFEALPFSIFYRSSQYRDALELQQGFATTLVLLTLSLALLAGASKLQRTLEQRWQGTRENY